MEDEQLKAQVSSLRRDNAQLCAQVDQLTAEILDSLIGVPTLYRHSRLTLSAVKTKPAQPERKGVTRNGDLLF